MNNLFHVIKDPVHGTMQFSAIENAWVKPFIDSRNFQRLRFIKQLGLGDFIFPGAVHSRFNHCLGCCYVGSQIADKIGLSKEEKQLVVIACLLHDIGHGPFSHTFEDIFKQKSIRHEDWTPYFLEEYANEDFFAYYNTINPDYPLTKAKFQLIAAMIMHQVSRKNILSDIVSSQLDADRLDYLLRDNHFCGVKYGEYDLSWMLHCMVIVNTASGQRLGISDKGVGVVEHYLMARRLMIRNIYQSQKKLALEALLIELLANLAQVIETKPAYKTIQRTRLGQFLSATNQFNHASKLKKTDDKHKSLFLKQNYENYKALCDDDIFSLINQLAKMTDDDTPSQIARRILGRDIPKIFRIDAANIPQVEDELAELHHRYADVFQPWQLMLIRTPHRAYSGEEDPILVINEMDQIQPISKYSLMIDAISDKFEHIAFLSVDKTIVEDQRIMPFIKSCQQSY